MSNPNIVNENNLPSNLVEEPSVLVPGAKAPSAPPVSPDMPQYFSGSLSPSLQHDSSFVATEIGSPRIPKIALMPLGTQADPTINAATQSTAKIIAQEVVASTPSSSGSGGGLTSVGLTMPSIFTVAGSPVTVSGSSFNVSLATEAPNTFFASPGSGLGSLEALDSNGLANSSGSTVILSAQATPSTTTSWGFLTIGTNSTNPFSGGWTQQGTYQVYTNSFTGTTPVSVNYSVSTSSAVAMNLAIFAGSLPTIVQTKQSAITLSGTNGSGSISFTSNNTAGNLLIVVMSGANSSYGPFSFSFSDSLGNVYTILANEQAGSSVWSASSLLAIVPSCLSGANTINYSWVGRVGGGASANISIYEFTPPSAAPTTPFFRPLIVSDIPPISLSATGNGGVTGVLPIGKGGTGANLGASGGSSKVLQQTSLGGVVTVAQLAASDLSNGTTGAGAVVLASGAPLKVASVDLTAQTAAKATTTLFSVVTAGQYRVSWDSKVTTAAGTTSTLGALTITYTDVDGVVQTVTAVAQSSAGVIETSDSGNATTTVLLGMPLLLNCKSATNIQYAFAYASNPASAMNYNLHIRVEEM